MAWNPKFVLYARAHGRSPREQRDCDEGNHEFVLWLREQRALWAHETYERRGGFDSQGAWTLEQLASFDAWLDSRFGVEPCE